MRAVALSALVWGCNGSSGDTAASQTTGPCDIPTRPAITPLSGVSPNPPVQDHAVLPVVRGLQGGFHTYLSIEARGMERGADSLAEGLREGSLPVTRWRIIANDGDVTVDQEHWTVAEDQDPAWVTGPHLVVMQYYETPPAEGFDRDAREAALEQEALQLEVRVTDACGRSATATRTVHIAFTEDPTGADTGTPGR